MNGLFNVPKTYTQIRERQARIIIFTKTNFNIKTLKVERIIIIVIIKIEIDLEDYNNE